MQQLRVHCVPWKAAAHMVPGMQCTCRNGLGGQLCAGRRHSAMPGQPHKAEGSPSLLLHTA